MTTRLLMTIDGHVDDDGTQEEQLGRRTISTGKDEDKDATMTRRF